MNKTNLIDLLKFAEFTNLFSSIHRKTILNKDNSAENNAQHSFQMAIIGWYICSKENLNLSIEKIIKYSLVHDLMETYSGNYPAYDRNKANQIQKDDAEKLALDRIKKEFQDFEDLSIALEDYTNQTDNESKFVYALDKLIPIINIELNNNNFYFKTKTTYEDMLKVKEEKIKTDPTIYKYFLLLKKYLTEDVKFFWPDNKDRDYSKKNYSFSD